MPTPQKDKIRKVYDALLESYDMESYDEFERKMINDTDGARRKVYDALAEDYDMEPYAEYLANMGMSETATAAQPQNAQPSAQTKQTYVSPYIAAPSGTTDGEPTMYRTNEFGIIQESKQEKAEREQAAARRRQAAAPTVRQGEGKPQTQAQPEGENDTLTETVGKVMDIVIDRKIANGEVLTPEEQQRLASREFDTMPLTTQWAVNYGGVKTSAISDFTPVGGNGATPNPYMVTLPSDPMQGEYDKNIKAFYERLRKAGYELADYNEFAEALRGGALGQLYEQLTSDGVVKGLESMEALTKSMGLDTPYMQEKRDNLDFGFERSAMYMSMPAAIKTKMARGEDLNDEERAIVVAARGRYRAARKAKIDEEENIKLAREATRENVKTKLEEIEGRKGLVRSQIKEVEDRQKQELAAQYEKEGYHSDEYGHYDNYTEDSREMAQLRGKHYNETAAMRGEISLYNAAQRKLSDAQHLIDEADHNARGGFGSKFVAGAARGFGQKLIDIRTWSFGIVDMVEGGMLRTALEKYEAGKELTEAEQTYLDALAIETATQMYFKEFVGRGYTAGQVTAESLPFMLEMMINPASAIGKSTQAMFARYALRRFAVKKGADTAKRQAAIATLRGLEQSGLRNASKEALKAGFKTAGTGGKVAQVLGRVLGDAAGAGVMAGTTGAARVAADAGERMVGDIMPTFDRDGNIHYGGRKDYEKDEGKAYLKAFAATAIGYFSEMMGAYNGLVPDAAKAMMAKGAARFAERYGKAAGYKRVMAMMGKIKQSDAAQVLGNFADKTQWHGAFGEFVEEVEDGFLNAIIVGDQTLDDDPDTGLFNKSNLIDTGLGVSIMSFVMGAAKGGVYSYQLAKAKRLQGRAAEIAEQAFGDDDRWNGIATQIDNAVPDELAEVIEKQLEDPNLTMAQRKAIFEYGRARGIMMAVDEVAQHEYTEDDEYGMAYRALSTNIGAMQEQGYGTTDAEGRARAYKALSEIYPKFVEQYGKEEAQKLIYAINNSELPLIDVSQYEQGGTYREFVDAVATSTAAADRYDDDLNDRFKEVRERLDGMKNKQSGRIIPVRMKDNPDKRVYVIDGHVERAEDGTVVKDASDADLVVFDPATGEQSMRSVADVVSAEEEIDAEAAYSIETGEIQAAMEEAERAAERGIEAIDHAASLDKTKPIDIATSDGGVIQVEVIGEEQGDDGLTYVRVREVGGKEEMSLREDVLSELALQANEQQAANEQEEEGKGEYRGVFAAGSRRRMMDAFGTFHDIEIVSDNNDGSVMVREEGVEYPLAKAKILDGIERAGRYDATHRTSRYNQGDELWLDDGEGEHRVQVLSVQADGTVSVYDPETGEIVDIDEKSLDEAVEATRAKYKVSLDADSSYDGLNDEGESVKMTIQGESVNEGGETMYDVVLTDGDGKESLVTLSEADIQHYVDNERHARMGADKAAKATADAMPLTEEGKPDYEAADVARTVRYVYEESGLDEEVADQFVENKGKEAQGALEKVMRKEPKIGTDIDEYKAAHERWAAEVEAARKSKEYWDAVKAERERVKTEKVRVADDNAYKAAVAQGRTEAFEEYLNSYPDGIHAEEAKQMIAFAKRKGHKQIMAAKKKLQEAGDVMEKAQAISDFIYNVYHGAEATEEENAMFDEARRELASQGYEIVDVLGQPYHEGMKAQAQFVTDTSLPVGTAVITGVRKPQVNKDGRMVQAAEVTVTQAAFGDQGEVDEAIRKARAGDKDAQALLDECGIEWVDKDVPDWKADKASDARARGYRMADGVRYDRQQPTEGVYGDEVDIDFTTQEKPVRGRYKVVEASSVQPSHTSGHRNVYHFISEAQPKERTDKTSEAESTRIASDMKPDRITGGTNAYGGAPVVNARGEVIQGNNRAIALRKMWGERHEESQASYRQYLIEHAAEFGLDADAVAQMENPVLVRELDVEDEEAIRLGQFAATDLETGGIVRIEPRSTNAKMTAEQVVRSYGILFNTDNSEATIGELIEANGDRYLAYLHQVGAISSTQMQSAYKRDGKTLTEDARSDIRKMMLFNILNGGADGIEAAFESLPDRVKKALPQSMAGDMRLEEGDRLLPDVQKAIMACVEVTNSDLMRKAIEGMGKKQMKLEDYQSVIGSLAGQMSLTDRPLGERYTELQLEIAAHLLADTQTRLKEIFAEYQRLILGESGNMFQETEKLSREEAIERVFEVKPNKASSNDTRRETKNLPTGGEERGGEGASGGRAGTADGRAGRERAAKSSRGRVGGESADDSGSEKGKQESPSAEKAEGNGVLSAENGGKDNASNSKAAARVAKAKEIAERLVRADNADNGDYLEEHEAKQELLAHLRTMTDEERAQAFPWYKRGEKGNAPDGGGAVEVALAEDDVRREVSANLQTVIDEGERPQRTGKTLDGKQSGVASFAMSVKEAKKDSRLVLTGIHHDAEERVAVATDGHLMVWSSDEYDEKHAGQTIATATAENNGERVQKGEPIEGRYPKWKNVVESNANKHGKHAQEIDLQGLADFLADLQERIKADYAALKELYPNYKVKLSEYEQNTRVVMRMHDGTVVVVPYSGLKAMTEAAVRMEARQMVWNGEESAVMLRGERGGAMLMPIATDNFRDKEAVRKLMTLDGYGEESAGRLWGYAVKGMEDEKNEEKGEEKGEEKKKDLSGFVEGMTKMQRGRTEKVLGERFNYSEGGVMTRAERMERKVSEGAVFSKHLDDKGKTVYSFENSDGSYTIITKTEYDYAAYLGGKAASEEAFEGERRRFRRGELSAKFDYPTMERIEKMIEWKERTLRVINPNGTEGQRVTKELEELKELKSLREEDAKTSNEVTEQGESGSGNGERQQRVDSAGKASRVSKVEKALRDGVVRLLRKMGIEVSEDWKEGERVLAAAEDMVREQVVEETKNKVLSEFERAKQGNAAGERIPIGKLTKQGREYLQDISGISIKPDVDFILNSSDLRHIYNDHYGENEKDKGNNIPLTDEDIRSMVDTITSPDKVVFGTDKEDGRKLFFFIKQAADGTYNLTEVYADRRGNLTAKSFFKSKKSIAQRADELLNSPKLKTSETGGESSFSSAKIPQIFEPAKNNSVREMRVYHGTAADFDRFDHRHMGEGEGAQAYGWGTYVTQVEGIGKAYAHTAVSVNEPYNDVKYVGTTLSESDAKVLAGLFNGGRRDWQGVLDFLQASAEKGSERSRRYIEKFKSTRPEDWVAPTSGRRYLYTVEIPDDNGSNYLEWNKPIKQKQLTKIASALAKEKGKEYGDYLKEKKGSYGENIYYELYTSLGSKQAASELLHSAGFTGIKVPTGFISGESVEGKYNYVIFNESDARITGKTKFMRTPDGGEAYGFTKDGVIHLDPRIATSETAVHEYAHLWSEALRRANPAAWERLKEEMLGQEDVLEYVKRLYPELEGDELMEEVFAHYAGRRGAERLRAEMAEEMEKAEGVFAKGMVARVFAKIRNAVRAFWNQTRQLFAGRVEGLDKVSAEDFADMTLADLLGGYNPRTGRTAEERRIEEEAKMDGTWMQAPNGKKSNLTERQWVQVRTAAFKRWFGDWEKAQLIRQARNAWNDPESKNKFTFSISDRLAEAFSNLLGHEIKTVTITDDAIRHIKKGHSSGEEKRGQVNLTPEDIAIIPYILNNYDAIERSPEYDDRMGNRAITVRKRINGVSVVATIEQGKNKEFVVTQWQYMRSDALDAAVATPGPNVRNDSDSDAAKIRKEIETLKKSVEKCSAVVDENGEPRVVYHQTGNEFTVFDTRHSGAGTTDMQMPFGIFLKPTERNIGIQGSRQMALFARITNPLRLANRDVLKQYLSDNVPGYREAQEAYERIDREYQMQLDAIEAEEDREYKEVWQKRRDGEMSEEEYQERIKKIYAKSEQILNEWTTKSNEQGAVMKQMVDEYMRGGEYDGIVLEQDEGSFGRSTMTLLAYEPTQVKSAEENVGTYDGANADVRYQISDMDEEYMDAVERGDMETAQRLVYEAARLAGYMPDSDYRATHTAPTGRDGFSVSINDATKGIYPEDLYSPDGYRYYGSGRAMDMQSWSIFKRVKGNPDAQVAIYRAVPKSVKETKLRNGDWVTINEDYARQHGEAHIKGPYKIIKDTVPAKYVFTNGDSLHEQGYDDGGNYAYKDTKNNRKLLDAVTYDDEGNVIPLSKRFNKRNGDVRYHRRSGGETAGQLSLFGDEEVENARGKAERGAAAQSRLPRLRRLREGEKCYVERRLSEDKSFTLVGRSEKVETVDDVAYIFRCLEDKAVEHTFLVFVKDGVPTIVHAGMGSAVQSAMDLSTLAPMIEQMKPDAIYSVHNHPSGKLTASANDQQLYSAIRSTVPAGVRVEHVIIDTYRHDYNVIRHTGYANQDFAVETRRQGEESGSGEKMKLYAFDSKKYNEDYKERHVSDAADVAAYVSSLRLGDAKKVGVLVLDNANNICGVVCPNVNSMDEIEEEGVIRGLLSDAMMMGGRQVMVFGTGVDMANTSREQVSRLKQRIRSLSGMSMSLLDIVETGKWGGYYVSAQLEGKLRESGAEYEGERREESEVGENSSSEEDGLLFRDEEGEMFYSPARRAVEGVKQGKATGEQWLRMIEKAGGLKAGEDKWTGLSEWLKENKDKSLTKEDVLEYLAENEVQVEEVEYEDAADNADFESLKKEYDKMLRDEGYDYAWEQLRERFGDDAEIAFTDIGGELGIDNGEAASVLLRMNRPIQETRLEYTTEGLENKREIALTVPTIEPWNENDEIHFGDADGGRAVAWVRFGETRDADGRRVLVIDEVQSKRHQEGREKGYANVTDWQYRERLLKAKGDAWDELQGYNKELEKKGVRYPSERSEEEQRKHEKLVKAYKEAEEKLIVWEQQFGYHGSVPDAPFEKNWHELAMKRMLRYAAENGYDKVAWTKGEQQAARYNIGNAVRNIDAGIDQNGNRVMLIHLNQGGTVDITHDNEGNITHMNNIGKDVGLGEAKNIRDIVGKDIALQALTITDKGTENMKNWKGNGLRIGGEGMKGFYDQMLPRFMDKYGKRWGVRTKDVVLPDVEASGRVMHSVDVTEEMKESVMAGQPLFREVTDEDEIERLEGEPTIRVYRAMQVIDGQLYPPMSAKVNGRLREPSHLGRWERADENPELATEDGKFKLDKGNRKSVPAAYNPYLHTSTTMLNDQFSEAQNRPNLVVVEMEVPVSELTSGYKAERAKDGVGVHDWKAGVVQGKLTGMREVILSRWAKPVRVVPASEVAESIMEQIDGELESLPSNVLTPDVRAELEKRGVRIVETDTKGRIVEGADKGKTWSETQKGVKPADMVRSTVNRLAGKLGTKVRIIESRDELPQGWTERQKRTRRGWYDSRTGEVVVILPNQTSAADAERTVLHEVVGHKGLRRLFGEDFDTMLDNVYENATDEIRSRIDADVRSGKLNRREATEEYMARLAEDEKAMKEAQRSGLWDKIKGWLMDMLRKAGVRLPHRLTDNDLRYILWASRKNMEERDAMSKAEDIVMRQRLGVEGESREEDRVYAGRSGEREDMEDERHLWEDNLDLEMEQDAFNEFFEGAKARNERPEREEDYSEEEYQEELSYWERECAEEAFERQRMSYDERQMDDGVSEKDIIDFADAYELVKTDDGYTVEPKKDNQGRLTEDAKRALGITRQPTQYERQTKTIEELQSAMGLSKVRTRTQYVRGETKDGDKWVIRIGDHAANANNFRMYDPDADYVLSIVVDNEFDPHRQRQERMQDEMRDRHQIVITSDLWESDKEGLLSEIEKFKETGVFEYDDGLLFRNDDVEDVNRLFNEELEKQIDGTLPAGHVYNMGFPSAILRSTGFPDVPIELSASHLAKKAQASHHPFDISEIKDLVQSLQNPMAVFVYGEKGKAQNVIIEIQHDGKSFVVGIHFNQKRGNAEVSSIRGLYPKDNAEWLNWISQGKALYIDKEKIQTLIDQQRKNLADVEYLDLEDVAKIVNNFENPEIKDDGLLFREEDGSESSDGSDGSEVADEAMETTPMTLYEKMTDALIRLAKERGDNVRLWKGVHRALREKLNEIGVEMVGKRTFDRGTLADLVSVAKMMVRGDIVEESEVRPLIESISNGTDADGATVQLKTILDKAQKRDEENTVLFGGDDYTQRDRVIAREAYERMVSSGRFQFREAMQDSMLGLRRLYEAVLGKGTRIEDVEDGMNAYTAENRMSSMNAAEQHEYFRVYMNAILEAIHEIAGSNKEERQALTDYMMAKHGLERNERFAARDARAAEKEGADYDETYGQNRKRDYAGLTALTGEKDVEKAEEKARQMVDEFEAKHDTRKLWDSTNAATKATLKKLYDSGVLSAESYGEISQMFEYYIPLQGWDETTSDEVYGYLTSKDGPLRGSPIKHAKGRSSKADDPIATIAMMADAAIQQGNRNEMKQRFLNFVLSHPSDAVSVSGLWLEKRLGSDEWVPAFPEIADSDTPEEVENKVAAFEARMEAAKAVNPNMVKHGGEAANIPYKVKPGMISEHQVLVKRGGMTYVLTINGNPRAAQALNGLTNPDTKVGGIFDAVIKSGEWVNRQLSAAYTTRNPDFMLSNFLRDAIYSNSMVWVKEKGNYALKFHKNFGKFNPGTMAVLFTKWERGTLDENNYMESMFKDFMMNGGETGYTNVKDIEKHKKEIAKVLKRQSDKTRAALSALGIGLDVLNRSVENCARFAAFVTSRELGRSMGRSIYDAKEVSVNFNKKGAGDRFMRAEGQTVLGKIGAIGSGAGRGLFVFWNAGMQGMTNFGRAFKHHPVKATAGAAAMFSLGVVVPLIAKAMTAGGDDDDKNAYYNLPEYIRRSNICIYAGDKWVTIPLPIEYRAIYGLGELATGVLTGEEHYSDGEMAKQFISQMSQVLPLDFMEGGGGWHAFVPSAVKPFVEAQGNRRWTGLPLYRDNPYDEDKELPEWTKAYSSTDKHFVEAAKGISDMTGGDDYVEGWIDINPAKVEYMLNGYLGGYFSTPAKLVKMTETAFGERDFDWRNMLFANRVIKTGDETTKMRKIQNDYFRYKDEYEETKRRYKAYEKEANAGVERYAEKLNDLNYSERYARYLIFDDYGKAVERLYKMKEYEKDEEMKALIAEEHDEMMRLLVETIREYDKTERVPEQKEMNEHIREVNEKINEAYNKKRKSS